MAQSGSALSVDAATKGSPGPKLCCVTSRPRGDGASSRTNPRRAIAADAFTATLGIEVHLQYNVAYAGGASPYSHVEQVVREIGFLNPNGPGTGVAIFRDSQVPGAAVLQRVAEATGARADLYYGYDASSANSLSGFCSVADALLANGQLASVEGGLEVDNEGWGLAVHSGTYTSLDGKTTSGWQAVIASQSDLYRHYHGKVPVMLWSLAVPSDGSASSPAALAAKKIGATISSIADVGNLHFYAHHGQNPQAEERGFLVQETGYTPGLPFATTETGFNYGNNSDGAYAGNEVANAVYTLENALNLARDGSIQTDIYELNNDMVSGGFEDHWGIFNNDGTPKLAASLLRNFLAVVSDGKTNAAETTTEALDLTITGMPDPADTMLTAKKDGTPDLTLWDNQSLSDRSGQTIQPKSTAVHVDLGKVFSTVQVFDPLKSAKPFRTLRNVSAVDITLAGSPLIIQMAERLGSNAFSMSSNQAHHLRGLNPSQRDLPTRLAPSDD